MTLFYLTDNNLEYVKRILRKHLPSVKSSHITEALAISLGHQTHASLLTRLKESDRKNLGITKLNKSNFFARLVEFGYQVTSNEILSGVLRSPELPDAIWREIKGKDIPARNKWFKECERRNIPYVYVTVRRKYAQINWDCISTNGNHAIRGSGDKSATLVDALYKTFQRLISGKKAYFYGSAFVGDIDNLTPDEARDLADEIFSLLYIALNEKSDSNLSETHKFVPVDSRSASLPSDQT